MASASKTITIGSPSGYTYNLTANFNENSTNTSGNTSNVTVTATIKSNGASWSSSYNSTLIIYWHDNRENYDRQVASINLKSLGINASASASGTINVTHNNDGNLSGYAYASFNKGGTSSYTPYSSGVTTDWTALTKIDRYPTLVSGSNFTDIQNPVYNISNPDTTHTVRVKIEAGGNTQLITRNLSVGFNGTYTLELTEAERNTLRALTPNSKTLAVRETVCAMNGNTELSANFKDYTMTIVDADPTLSATYEDTNSTTTNITGNNQLIIRNNSTLEIDVSNATAYKSATLSTITTELNGTIYNGTLSDGSATFDIGTINVSENITAVVTLTDSRGFIGTKNVNIQVLDWVLPTAIINLQRENNFYSETNINVNAEYSSLDNKNTISIKARYKKVTDTTYSSYTTLQDDVTTQFTLDNNYEWNVQVVLEDRLGTTTYNLVLDRGIPIAFFDRLKRSLGIDCFPADTESLEVDGENILTRIAGYGQGANQVTGDWNTACGTASGFYMGNGLTNSPAGTTVDGWWWVIHLVHNSEYQRQIAFSFLNNGEIYTRIQNNGTWNSWTLVGSNTPTVLYSNPSGTNGNITLSDSVANYSSIEIHFRTNDGANYRGSQKLLVSSGTILTSLQYLHCDTVGHYWIKGKEALINGVSITNNGYIEVGTNTSATNCIYITQVLGYK